MHKHGQHSVILHGYCTHILQSDHIYWWHVNEVLWFCRVDFFSVIECECPHSSNNTATYFFSTSPQLTCAWKHIYKWYVCNILFTFHNQFQWFSHFVFLSFIAAVLMINYGKKYNKYRSKNLYRQIGLAAIVVAAPATDAAAVVVVHPLSLSLITYFYCKWHLRKLANV